MKVHVVKNENSISQELRGVISTRYKTITKAVNASLWDVNSDTAHSFYVGSYGRGTAVDTSDIDILVEVPQSYYIQNTDSSYNPQSRLLQVVKDAILQIYPRSNVHADGQVVVIIFSDNVKFEVLPAVLKKDYWGRINYWYPDSHMGGRWMSTNPKAEQEAMKNKNNASNGLLFDTCKHMRYIRDNYFSSYHLSGIVIDSFVYNAMGNWRWLQPTEGSGSAAGEYENILLHYYNNKSLYGQLEFDIYAPGSGDRVSLSDSMICLGKVLKKMAE